MRAALFLPLLFVASAAQAAEAPKSVGIFVLSGEEVGTPISELYAAARRGIESETALDVAPLEVFPPSVRQTAIRQCAGDGACFAERVRQAGVDVDLLLLISADRIGEGILLGLRLVDLRLAAEGKKPELAAVGEELPEGASLLRAMKDYLAGVFPKEIWGQVASVKVEANQPNAEVLVGATPCVSPCKLERMTPGQYEIVIRKAGYREWRGTIDLGSRQDETISATLQEEEASLVANPLFWAAIIGAAAVGVGAVFLLRPSNSPFEICVADSEEMCR
jgi:hypothetical protein